MRKPGQLAATKYKPKKCKKCGKDCMTELGYWTDDALVASEITEKFWGELPGIYIAIEEVGQ